MLEDGHGGYRTISLIPTSSGAHMSLELDRRFVARRAGMLGGSGRAILVFHPVDEAAR